MGVQQKTLLMLCVARVAFAGSGKGDSGGPVFARAQTDGPHYALGIIAAGGPLDEPVCSQGNLCWYLFSSWGSIENVLGLGTLSPMTIP